MLRTGSSSLSRRRVRAGLALSLAPSLVLLGLSAVAPVARAATTLTVSTTADISASAGACGDGSITTPPSPLSLREAACLANNLGGDVTITVPPGTYHLTNGELRLGNGPGQNTTIVGAGSTSTVIDAGGLSRVLELDFNLTGGVNTSISGLTLRGGSDNTFGGAGIIAGSGTSGTADSLSISNSTITGNQTSPAASYLPGGAVQFVGGSLTISNSTISNNSSGNSAGSGVYYQGEGMVAGERLSITGSTFSGNSAVADAAGVANGGGLWLAGASYDVSGSRFINNTVTGTGGPARGAAIWSQNGALSVTGSTFTGNSAAAGGAIAIDGGSATLHYNRLTSNTAASGSALSSGAGAGVDATENWWGCGTGPGTTGCDTVSGGATVAPRLVLTASANPATVTGPNGTSTVTATLTGDSVGAAVDPANLGAFAGLPVSWTDPQPAGASVSVTSAVLSAGSASTTYNSNATSGAGHLIATLDHGDATASITIVVNQLPVISSADHTSFVVGSPGSFSITTTGLPSATLSHAGAQFPAWLTLTDHGNGTGTLTGTPPAGSAGTYQFTVQATNSAGQASQTFTLEVDDSPVITSADHATFTVGSAGSFAVTTTAGFPVATGLTETGPLPSGVTFHDNGDGTAALAGTPAAGTGGSYPITITAIAVGGLAVSATQSFALSVLAPPAFTSADHATFAAGSAGSFTVITTAGNPASATLSYTGSLPAGIAFVDNGDGTATIAGTPSSGGVYPIAITASDGVAPDATQAFTLSITAAPAFTSADHATLTVGVPVSFTVTTDGQPTPSLTETGSLPPGMTFHDNGDGTATLGGTPTAGGSYTFTITASNGVLPKANQSFSATVYASPVITSANNATFAVGSAGSFTVTTTPGIPAATALTEIGGLPSGVTFIDNGNGTATLAGTPAAGTGGIYILTLTASNGVPPNSTQAFGLTVTDVPAITSANNATFTAGSAGSFTVTTRAGFPTPTAIAEAGVLPSGITLTDNGNGTATLAGTAAVGSGGSYSVTLTASNSIGHNDQAFTLTVSERPAITSANSATFAVGSAGSFTVTTVAGYPTATALTESGSLPSGITFTDNGDGTATLAGTPTAGSGGRFGLTLRASNSMGGTSQSFILTVNEAPVITSADNASFGVGASSWFTVTTTIPYPQPPSLSYAGALPSGVTFNYSGGNSADIRGVPADGSQGVYPITITASNGVAPDATQTFTLTVYPPPVFTSADQATFTVGTPGTFTVTTIGQPTPSLSVGLDGMPPGITFTDHGDGTGTLAGTPTASGSYVLSITAKNQVFPGGGIYQRFTLTVNGPPVISGANQTTFAVGSFGSFWLSTGQSVPAVTSITESGSLPSGVTFHDSGGTAYLDGTPAAGTAGSYPITFTASNGISPAAVQNFTLTVTAVPVITSANHATFAAGSTGAFTVTTVGQGVASLSMAGSLPSGVAFHDNGNGTASLAGTPTAGIGGSYPLTLTATNSMGSTNQAFTLTVTAPPVITSANSVTFAAGLAGSFTVTTNPTATTLTESGSLPAGMTFVDNGNGTATLAGTPAAGTRGAYPINIIASNGVPPNATQNLTLTVTDLPVFTSANHAAFAAGSAGSFTVTTVGLQVASLTESGSLPSGVTFQDNGNGTATLAGTPAAGSDGSYPLTLTATNSVGSSSQAFTLTVNARPSFTSADHATFAVGSAGSFTVTTTAGTPAATTISESGSLPSGVTFTDNGDGTATLAGTPATGQGGSYSITFTASNGLLPNSTQAFGLTVTEAPVITSANQATFAVGNAGSFTVTTRAGFPTATTLTEVGTLPVGVSFTDNGNGTATFAGTPATGDGGWYYPTLRASNSAGLTSQALTLTVDAAPVITSADHTTFAVGSAGSFTVTTTWGVPAAPTTMTESGVLPPGVTFVDNGHGTATLAGTPAAGSGGSYSITVTASNGVLPNSPQSFTLTVTELPAFTSADHANFAVGSAGSFTVTTHAGFPTATTLTEVGSLPSGMTFADNGNGTAALTGTPAAGSGGSYPLTFTATNSVGHSDQAFTLTVGASPTITSADHATFTKGTAGAFTVTTSGGFPMPPALSESGALPGGVTFHDNGNGTATLAGTPTVGGIFTFTITANNGVAPATTQTFTLTVNGPPVFTSPSTATFQTGSTRCESFLVSTTPLGSASSTVITKSGALPASMTLKDSGDGTAILSGCPLTGDIGSYVVTLTAANPGGSSKQTFTLKVVRSAWTDVTLPSSLPASDGTLQGVPAQTALGQVLNLSGSGYPSTASITIAYYPGPVTLTQVTTSTAGTFTATITMSKPGSHTFVAAAFGATYPTPRYLEAGSTTAQAAP